MNDINEVLGEWWSTGLPFVMTTLEILGIASAWHAVSKVRTSQAAVAWAVGLVGMPALVLPMYWTFGRNKFGGYRAAIRQVEREHKESVAAVRNELQTKKNAGDPTADSPLGVLADTLDTPRCGGNRFELLVDGKAFFDKLIQEIRSARSYVYAEFYIIRDDEIGRQFAQALCDAAQAGKTVRLLYDEVGCLKLPNAYVRKLEQSGVEVSAFNTRQGWANRFQLNFRNHRKLLVVDGQRALVGGLNVGDEYLGRAKWAPRWRDTGVWGEGDIARKLQAVFAADYYWARRVDLPEADWSETEPARSETPAHSDEPLRAGDGCEAAVCATGPSDQRQRATMMFAAAAVAAKRRLWISTPYLVPDDTCINALSMARARGVDVRIMIPDVRDVWLVYLAAFYYEEAFEAIGIPVYRYNDGFLHQKCVLVDDQLVLIGSTNLDNRSLHLNFELMLATGCPEMIRRVTEMLEQDFADCKEKSTKHPRLLPWYVRVGTVVARLFSPIL
ncbi:cardiolipin synthase [Roseimaritima sediminicola]|uniref:cardiolipin synthase n=1 Tax=Roseimaritima sediminicola TaxID=2662066 RepID=UPI0012984DFF|nr:cardiolipin synthase [Roseimaritima sediminicola]